MRFRGAGLVSIMLDTQRKDLMRAISNVITCKDDHGKSYERYLLDPGSMVGDTELPPLFLVTSEEDLIQKDSLKLDRLLTAAGKEYELLDFPKGGERQLIHVFSVSYPMYPESREVFDRTSAYLLAR